MGVEKECICNDERYTDDGINEANVVMGGLRLVRRGWHNEKNGMAVVANDALEGERIVHLPKQIEAARADSSFRDELTDGFDKARRFLAEKLHIDVAEEPTNV